MRTLYTTLIACVLSINLCFSAQIPDYMWVSPASIQQLPMQGAAWLSLKNYADKPITPPNLSNQDDMTNVYIFAKALVYQRTKIEEYRQQVIDACMAAIDTENGGRTLALGRELIAYVIAAQLVGLPPAQDAIFRDWLNNVRYEDLQGRTLISTHEQRPNNWGTHAGASRIAVALYLGDMEDLEEAARIFQGWLGDRNAYAGFKYTNPEWWQANPKRPVGINPKKSKRSGYSIDGVLPEEQRRAGDFSWPPPKENYVYEGLQGALATAVLLHNSGYDVWNWSDKALLRAFKWLHNVAYFPAEGDDTWQPHIINYYYRTHFPAPIPSKPGKNVGWTDWTHQ